MPKKLITLKKGNTPGTRFLMFTEREFVDGFESSTKIGFLAVEEAVAAEKLTYAQANPDEFVYTEHRGGDQWKVERIISA